MVFWRYVYGNKEHINVYTCTENQRSSEWFNDESVAESDIIVPSQIDHQIEVSLVLEKDWIHPNKKEIISGVFSLKAPEPNELHAEQPSVHFFPLEKAM